MPLREQHSFMQRARDINASEGHRIYGGRLAGEQLPAAFVSLIGNEGTGHHGVGQSLATLLFSYDFARLLVDNTHTSRRSDQQMRRYEPVPGTQRWRPRASTVAGAGELGRSSSSRLADPRFEQDDALLAPLLARDADGLCRGLRARRGETLVLMYSFPMGLSRAERDPASPQYNLSFLYDSLALCGVRRRVAIKLWRDPVARANSSFRRFGHRVHMSNAMLLKESLWWEQHVIDEPLAALAVPTHVVSFDDYAANCTHEVWRLATFLFGALAPVWDGGAAGAADRLAKLVSEACRWLRVKQSQSQHF